jgi:hypothetical protein
MRALAAIALVAASDATAPQRETPAGRKLTLVRTKNSVLLVDVDLVVFTMRMEFTVGTGRTVAFLGELIASKIACREFYGEEQTARS